VRDNIKENKDILLKRNNFEYLRENTCCSQPDLITSNQVIQEYNQVAHKIAEELDVLNKRFVWPHSVLATRTKMDETFLFDTFSERDKYAALIYYFEFDKNDKPIPMDIRNYIGEKPPVGEYHSEWSLASKIEYFKENGMNVDSFDKVIQTIHRRNMVQVQGFSRGDPVLFEPTVELRDLVVNYADNNDGPLKIPTTLMKYLNAFFTGKQLSGGPSSELSQLDQLKRQLRLETGRMVHSITDYFKEYFTTSSIYDEYCMQRNCIDSFLRVSIGVTKKNILYNQQNGGITWMRQMIQELSTNMPAKYCHSPVREMCYEPHPDRKDQLKQIMEHVILKSSDLCKLMECIPLSTNTVFPDVVFDDETILLLHRYILLFILTIYMDSVVELMDDFEISLSSMMVVSKEGEEEEDTEEVEINESIAVRKLNEDLAQILFQMITTMQNDYKLAGNKKECLTKTQTMKDKACREKRLAEMKLTKSDRRVKRLLSQIYLLD
jgi:hypothetical protein